MAGQAPQPRQGAEFPEGWHRSSCSGWLFLCQPLILVPATPTGQSGHHPSAGAQIQGGLLVQEGSVRTLGHGLPSGTYPVIHACAQSFLLPSVSSLCLYASLTLCAHGPGTVIRLICLSLLPRSTSRRLPKTCSCTPTSNSVGSACGSAVQPFCCCPVRTPQQPSLPPFPASPSLLSQAAILQVNHTPSVPPVAPTRDNGAGCTGAGYGGS